MIRYSLLTLLLACSFLPVSSQNQASSLQPGAAGSCVPKGISTRVVSTEIKQANGRIQFSLQIEKQPGTAIEKVEIKSHHYKGKPCFTAMSDVVVPAGDWKNRQVDVAFSYDAGNLPYYPKDIEFNITYKIDGTLVAEPFTTKAKVYFTPYRTVEVWDEGDFWNLRRVWLVEQQPEPERKFVSKDSIPLSDLPTRKEDMNDWDDDWNYQFVEGLAYAIPMRRGNPVSIEDTTYTQGNHNPKGSNNQVQDHGCGFWAQRFHCEISGNLKSIIPVEVSGQLTEVDLSGLLVRVWENDFNQTNHWPLDDQLFGSAITDAQGNFAITFNRCQSKLLEGNNIELYIEVVARDPAVNVRAKTSFWQLDISNFNLPAFTRRAIIGDIVLPVTGYPQVSHTVGTQYLTDLSHLSVVYVKHGLNFCNNNLNQTISGGITIWPHYNFTAGAGFYLPVQLLAFTPIWVQFLADFSPGIYLSTQLTGDEEDVYHEFGHHVMWALQNSFWLNPLTAGFLSHSYHTEVNPNLAWTEGWASGISAILDMGTYEVDQEFQFEFSRNFEGRTPLPNSTTNGFKNEFNFACVLFDLADGPSMFGNFGIPTTYNNLSGAAIYKDELQQLNNWADDCVGEDIELTFQQICQPIVDNQFPILISSFNEYYQELLKNANNCYEKRNLKNLFDNNGILENVNVQNSGFSSDIIQKEITVSHVVNSIDIFNQPLNFVTVNEDFLQDDFRLFTAADDFNYVFGSPDFIGSLRDDLEVINGAALSLNKNDHAGYIAEQSGNFPPLNSTFPVSLCGKMVLDIAANGTFQLGDLTAPTHALAGIENESVAIARNAGEIVVGASSVLSVKSGGTLILRTGSTLHIKDRGRVVVENGGYFCVEPGANIILEGPQSVLEIQPYAKAGINPNVVTCLQIDPTCQHLCDIPYTGQGTIDALACFEVSAGCNVQDRCALCPVVLSATVNPFMAVTYEWRELPSFNLVGTGQTITVTPTQTTTYRVYATNIYNITREDDITVNVNPNCQCQPNGGGGGGANMFSPPKTYIEYTLNTSQTWDNKQVDIEGFLRIPNGVTLTVNNNSTLAFSPCSKLIVEPGGRLELNNSTCEGNCNRWDGIEVWGDAGQPQGMGAQGEVIINNSVVRDAEIALLAGKRDSFDVFTFNYGGALITVTNSSTFQENGTHIVLTPYFGQTNSTLIENSLFLPLYDSLNGCLPTPYSSYIRSDGNFGPQIIGNTFIGGDSIVDIAIESINSSLTIRDNMFIGGMAGGVAASGMDTLHSSTISENQFVQTWNNSTYGGQVGTAVSVSNGTGYTMVLNTIGNHVETGVLLNTATGFTIIDNTINSHSKGIEAINTDAAQYSLVEENHFGNNVTGIHSANCDHSNLEILCNTFEGYTQYGICSDSSALKTQGNALTGTGNIFNGNSSQTNHQVFHNGPSTTYYFDPSNPISLVTNTNYTVTATGAQNNSSCMSQNKKGGEGQIRVEIQPNPAREISKAVITVTGSSILQLEIVDITGRTVQVVAEETTVNKGSNEYMLNTSQLSAGTYLLQITHQGIKTLKRFYVVK